MNLRQWVETKKEQQENVTPSSPEGVLELLKQQPVPIPLLVDALITEAVYLRASDLHIDPSETENTVRIRIDGLLQDLYIIPKQLQDEIISRIKILAKLRTDEHQAAQDGRFQMRIQGLPLDVRVSIVPMYFGENIVLRLLTRTMEASTLEQLGFSAENRAKILHAIGKPNGMVLATGPTGSGKTTTLYTLLEIIRSKEKSIVTIEDPIEYSIQGVNQIQVNSRTELTFANGLRSILRQDPNIIMVGEIRDKETANIATHTALTGHLLFSTLHTNNAATTLPRLLDLGIEAYVIASTVNIVIGQRLVRKICSECKEDYKLSDVEKQSMQLLAGVDNPELYYRGKGCTTCSGSGFRGRLGIYEVLVMDKPLREAVMQKAPADIIQAQATIGGMKTLLEDGLEKARVGLTSLTEILRVLYE